MCQNYNSLSHSEIVVIDMSESLLNTTLTMFRYRHDISNIYKKPVAYRHRSINPFPSEFPKWTLLSLNLGMSIIANRVSVNIKNWMANSVDADEIAHHEPSHLDLHCLQRYLTCFGLHGWNGSVLLLGIRKTRLFKYIENFTTKKGKISV